jgi:hypothetical protein
MTLFYNILYLKLVYFALICCSLSFKLCGKCAGNCVEFIFYYDDLTDLNDVRGSIAYNTRISFTELSIITISSTELSVITIFSSELSVLKLPVRTDTSVEEIDNTHLIH